MIWRILLAALAIGLGALGVWLVAEGSVESIDGGPLPWFACIPVAAIVLAYAAPGRRALLRGAVAGTFGGALAWLAGEAGLRAMIEAGGHFGWENEVHAANQVMGALYAFVLFALVALADWLRGAWSRSRAKA